MDHKYSYRLIYVLLVSSRIVNVEFTACELAGGRWQTAVGRQLAGDASPSLARSELRTRSAPDCRRLNFSALFKTKVFDNVNSTHERRKHDN